MVYTMKIEMKKETETKCSKSKNIQYFILCPQAFKIMSSCLGIVSMMESIISALNDHRKIVTR